MMTVYLEGDQIGQNSSSSSQSWKPIRPNRPSGSLIMMEMVDEQSFPNGFTQKDLSIPMMMPNHSSPDSLYLQKDEKFDCSYDDYNDQSFSNAPSITTSSKPAAPNPFKKSFRFWLIFLSLMVVTCLTAVDMTIISTTLPTIVKDLPESQISGSWITSSFLLTTTAFQPFMGGLSDVLGRRNSIVIAVLFFMAGSLISAKAETMLILVVGRGVQGIGGGGVQTIAEIILSDLTTLRERGIFVGLISLVFAIATFVAPVLGGYFSEHNWRLVFWINLPIGAISLLFIIPTMKLKHPQMPLMAKIHRMDIAANGILLGSVIAILIALTEGGITHPWSSWKIWLPFLMGWLGLILFFAIELIPNKFSPDPVLPQRLFTNKTSTMCFLMTFVHGLLTYGLIYLIPIYFQAIKSSTPLHSAIQLFPATAPGPFSAILAGILMVKTGTFRVQIWFWWSITLVGCGLLCFLDTNTPVYQWVLFQFVPGLGIGALFTLTLPPIQASLPVNEIAHATSTFAFCRSFGSVWGIALGTNVFVSVVNTKLEKIEGVSQLGLTGATALGFTTDLTQLPQSLQIPVQDAYMTAIRTSIYVFCPAALFGLLCSLFINDLPLPDFNEGERGIQEKGDEVNKIVNSTSQNTIKIDMKPNSIFTPAIPIHHHLRNRSLQRMNTVDSIDSRYTLETIKESLYTERIPYQSGFAL